jgi:hypothetical protein
VVAGRINAAGAAPIFVNPFGDGVLCSNTAGAVAVRTTGSTIPDGYSQLSYKRTWNNVITVWRGATYTPIFDKSYRYSLFALSTRANPMTINLAYGSTRVGTRLNQWPKSANASSSQFSVLASGSHWTIVPVNDATKCVAGAGSNGTPVTLQTCDGSTAQQWAFNTATSGYGTALVQNLASGRCLYSSDQLQGTTVVVNDCSVHSWMEFQISAGQ